MKKIDELKAEIKKVEKELESKKKVLEQLESDELIRVGDFVRYTYEGGGGVGMLMGTPDMGIIGDARVKTWSFDKVRAWGNIKKWQPQRGDLCIFWDKNRIYSVTAIFNRNLNGLFETTSGVNWINCIPFISEKQFKEHIGYEKC